MRYLAEDDTVFLSKEECEKYEEAIQKEAIEKQALLDSIDKARKELEELEQQYIDKYLLEDEYKPSLSDIFDGLQSLIFRL